MVDIEAIGVGFDTSGLLKGTAALKDNAKAANTAADAADKTTGSVGKLSTGFGSLKAILATLGVGVVAREFVQVADAMSLLDARLKIATNSALEFNDAQKQIYKIAQANNVGLQETAKLYTKLSDPVKALGGSTREVGAIVDAFATSMRVGGASAQEASSATLQFAQAMGSGKLSGDEFRSMAEASPRFMKALAEGMGVPTGALKEMSTEGKLTADIVGNALIKELSKLKEEAKGIPDTVGGSFTRMKNDIAVAVNEINKASGLTLGIAGLGEELGKVIPIIQSDLTGAFKDVRNWIDANRVALGDVWESSKNILAEVYEIGKLMVSVVGFTTDWAIQSGAVKNVLDNTQLLIAGLKDGVSLLGGAFATIGSIIFKFVLSPIAAVQTGLAAIMEAAGRGDLAEGLRKSAGSLREFAGAGAKYGDEIANSFARGDTAVNRLKNSLESASLASKNRNSQLGKDAMGSIGVLDSSNTPFKKLKPLAGTGDDKGTAAKISEYTRMEQEIKKVTAAQEQELQYGGKLTASAKFQFDEMQKINFALQTKKISQSESVKLIELTTAATAKMLEVERQAYMNDAIQKNNEAVEKQYQALKQSLEGMIASNEQQRLENETVGLSTESLNALVLLRQDNVIALKQQELITAQSNGADLASIGLMEREINLLKTRLELTGEKQAKTAFSTIEGQLNPSKPVYSEGEGDRIVGEESKKQAAYNATARVAIDSYVAIEQARLTSSEANGTATQKMVDDFNKLSESADAMKAKLTVSFETAVKVDGLDNIANNFEKLAATSGKMGDGFKKATSALSGFSGAFKNLAAAEKNHAKGSDEYIQAQVGGYGDMVGAAAEFFDKNSEGYEVLKAAEQGFRAVQLAMSIASMIQGKAETASAVADSATKGTASMWAGVAKAFEQLGIFGFIGAGAILAFLGSKFMGGGGGGGTAGAGNQIGADGRKAAPKEDDEPSNYDPATGTYSKQNKPQLTDAEVKARADAAAIDAAANAVNNLRIEAMKLTAGSEELEKSLARAKLAAGGMGIAHHELATQGMNEAELASYNYNQALKGQISVQMDIANGTSLTSENMKKLANESQQLAIDLLMASGDIAGARALQRQQDTSGYTKEEVAVYDHNQAVRDQIEALNAGASAAREAAQAEEQLAQIRYELSGRLNVLLGRQTQIQVDRAAELAGTTDEASIAMLKLIYQLEDMNTAVDASYEKLERSIAAERKIADVRLKAATDLSNALKTTYTAITPSLDRATAQSQIAMYVALAKAGGVLPSAAALKPVLDSIAKPSIDLFKTFEEYAIDQARTANDISDLSEFADQQVSEAQQTIDRLDSQLETAKQALDVLKGVDTSVVAVGDAVKAFEASMLTLANAKAGAGSFNFTAPSGSSGGGGGSGGGYSGGGSSSASTPTFEDIAGQSNKDIVAAYREYYKRNPDESGYENFVKSQLKGDKLMQAILAASSANKNGADYKMAVSRGYNPDSPTEKFLKSILNPSGGGGSGGGAIPEFSVGSNYIPHDMTARIHQGEEITPRPFVDMQRASREESNRLMQELVQSNKDMKAELVGLRAETRAVANHSGKTASYLDDVINGERTINTEVAA